MRTIFVILLLTIATIAFAQYEEEAHHILKDPSVSSELYKSSTVFAVTKPQLSPEIEFTKGQQAVKIPFSYPWQKFVFSSRIPIIRKTITYGDKSKSPIGIGDIAFTASYRSFVQSVVNYWFVNYAGNVTVKLPTGKSDNTVKIDGFELAAPMGSGATDFIISANVKFTRGVYTEIFGDVQIRLNGRDKDDVKFGNSFNIKGRYGLLQFEPKFDGYLTVLLLSNGDGEFDNPYGSNKIESSMFIIDVIPELHYLTSLGMAKVSIAIPMITSAKTKFTREVSVRFGLTKEF